MNQRVVITGIGLVTAAGDDRESTWKAVREGHRPIAPLVDLPGVPDNLVLAASLPGPRRGDWRLRNRPTARRAAAEAVADARLDLTCDSDRVAVVMPPTIGNTPSLADLRFGARLAGAEMSWWEEFIPSNVTADVANFLGAMGPRIGPTAACASSTVAIVSAMRAIQSGNCDRAIVGAVETIHPIMAAGFNNMRVLARNDVPAEACRPFDANRNGFVLGEGAAMMVLERSDEAMARGAEIYAEVIGAACCGEAHHVTDLNTDTSALEYVVRQSLRRAKLAPSDVAYVNAHGTGTLQNDVAESRALHQVFGQAASNLQVSSVKACLGHLVNAAGAAELAITALALRDGYAPPTANLTSPDPECDLDCIPLVGRRTELEHALKVSVAFGGHLAAIALRRWNEAGQRVSLLPHEAAA
ncbi:MAG: beta-ketoacyl-[acyl-carrier-protein] synthase family protein [Planctomycetales bacterium]|nr:beta-ketoacyl-[acyl-carrier-protein] synthase family protein [Planctomycetales bacterium]